MNACASFRALVLNLLAESSGGFSKGQNVLFNNFVAYVTQLIRLMVPILFWRYHVVVFKR